MAPLAANFTTSSSSLTRRQSGSAVIELFLALQIISASFFSIALVAAFISQRRGYANRHATWFSFCLAWAVYGWSYSILILAGKRESLLGLEGQQKPHWDVCTVQIGFIYGAPLIAVSATLSLIAHLLFEIAAAVIGIKFLTTWHRLHRFLPLLVILPWVNWAVIVIIYTAFAIQHQALVQLKLPQAYCTLESGFSNVTPIWSAVLGITTLILQIVIGTVAFRYRKIISRSGKAMAIRASVFTVILIIAIIAAVAYSSMPSAGSGLDLLIAAIGFIIFLVYGTQKDLFFALLPWQLSLEKADYNASRNVPDDGTTMIRSDMLGSDEETVNYQPGHDDDDDRKSYRSDVKGGGDEDWRRRRDSETVGTGTMYSEHGLQSRDFR